MFICSVLHQIKYALSANASGNDIDNEYYACNELLMKLEERKAKGVTIRSKVRWLEEGERCTQYFFGLEKFSYNKKQKRKIILDNHETVTTDSEILKE